MTSRPASARPEPTITDMTQHREVILASPPTDNSFSVVTYNILADCHMEPDWYGKLRDFYADLASFLPIYFQVLLHPK